MAYGSYGNPVECPGPPWISKFGGFLMTAWGGGFAIMGVLMALGVLLWILPLPEAWDVLISNSIDWAFFHWPMYLFLYGMGGIFVCLCLCLAIGALWELGRKRCDKAWAADKLQELLGELEGHGIIERGHSYRGVAYWRRVAEKGEE